jgi:FkbM family methyltransferase
LKNVNGLWLPDHEEHLEHYAKEGKYGEWTYQKHKLDAALQLCKGRLLNVAIDVGGHCGLWSKEMVKRFGHVHAFEPIQDHRDCFRLNVKAENYTLYPYALGEEEKQVSMFTRQGSSGDSWCIPGSDIEMKTLDSFNLSPDFIKLDCEGGELFALKGGEKTLKAYKPVICVEQKPGKAKVFGLGDTEAVTYLQGLGYRLAGEISGDYFLT